MISCILKFLKPFVHRLSATIDMEFSHTHWINSKLKPWIYDQQFMDSHSSKEISDYNHVWINSKIPFLDKLNKLYALEKLHIYTTVRSSVINNIYKKNKKSSQVAGGAEDGGIDKKDDDDSR